MTGLKMAITIDLQNDDSIAALPHQDQFRVWVEAALQKTYQALEQTIRIVGEEESRLLNSRFRGKASPTNVLSFPADADYLDYDCLGDLVICAPVVEAEASAQARPVESHWAHMVVHGMLHLQGFDHQGEAEASAMEALEIKILSTLGYSNPYNGEHD
jgi:probable rRNA maturation factor